MVLGIPGLEGVGGFDLSSLLSGAGQFIVLIFLFIIVGGIFYFASYKKKEAKKYSKKITWFEEINGPLEWVGSDKARELTIPGTNIQVFYIKEKDMYLPRPVKKMGKDTYWYAIKNNREIINFSMKNINEEMKEANLDFDHTDMRYAMNNLRELIKRNYRDKSQPWWREYKEVIGLVVIIFMLTLSFVFLFSKVGGLLGKISTLIQHVESLIKIAEATKGSGVIIQ